MDDPQPRLSNFRTWVADPSSACLIVNADDWGETKVTTDKIRDCIEAGSVTATSAMVFMQDSERAAELALAKSVDVGLHLNLSSPFTAKRTSSRLATHQAAVAAYLRRSRFTRYLYHPLLSVSFQYVVANQLEEFERLYGHSPRRIDGHHHLHLCANVVLARLLPARIVLRRNFTFIQQEKGAINRRTRNAFDAILSRQYLMVGALANLSPLTPAGRLREYLRIACHCSLELETHPAKADEYQFLIGSTFRTSV